MNHTTYHIKFSVRQNHQFMNIMISKVSRLSVLWTETQVYQDKPRVVFADKESRHQLFPSLALSHGDRGSLAGALVPRVSVCQLGFLEMTGCFAEGFLERALWR